jgi:hypothetical protein
MSCPLFETLALYVTNGLNKNEEDAVAAHLALPCQQCGEKLAWCRAQIAALKSPLKKGPDRLVDEAVALFQESLLKNSGPASIIFTTLVFDSARSAASGGMRSLEPSSEASRRLIFRADLSNTRLKQPMLPRYTFDIDIEVQHGQRDKSFTLRGQILFGPEDQVSVDLLGLELRSLEGICLHRTATNKFGEFVLHDVNEGYYTMQINGEKWLAVVNVPVSLPRTR